MTDAARLSMGPARLGASLLARKGLARPAQRRPLTLSPLQAGGAEIPPDVSGGETTAARLKFTLRLDGARHLKLRLAAAPSGRSMQVIALEAIDKYVRDLSREIRPGECPCLQGSDWDAGEGGRE